MGGRSIDEIFRGFHEEKLQAGRESCAHWRNRSIKSVRPTLLIRRDTTTCTSRARLRPFAIQSARGGVLVFHDVTESRELSAGSATPQATSTLTELVNRREFEARLERAQERKGA